MPFSKAITAKRSVNYPVRDLNFSEFKTLVTSLQILSVAKGLIERTKELISSIDPPLIYDRYIIDLWN